MSSLCGERLTSNVLDHYLHHDLIMLQLVFFAHLLIKEDLDHHQNLIFFIVPLGHLYKISSKSIHNFLSNVIHKRLNKQTNLRCQNITSFICLYSLNNNK